MPKSSDTSDNLTNRERPPERRNFHWFSIRSVCAMAVQDDLPHRSRRYIRPSRSRLLTKKATSKPAAARRIRQHEVSAVRRLARLSAPSPAAVRVQRSAQPLARASAPAQSSFRAARTLSSAREQRCLSEPRLPPDRETRNTEGGRQ